MSGKRLNGTLEMNGSAFALASFLFTRSVYLFSTSKILELKITPENRSRPAIFRQSGAPIPVTMETALPGCLKRAPRYLNSGFSDVFRGGMKASVNRAGQWMRNH